MFFEQQDSIRMISEGS